MKDLVADPSPAPTGSNFDLAAAGRIVGVVVTPNVITIPADQAIRGSGLPGLTVYASAEELLRWLRVH